MCFTQDPSISSFYFRKGGFCTNPRVFIKKILSEKAYYHWPVTVPNCIMNTMFQLQYLGSEEVAYIFLNSFANFFYILKNTVSSGGSRLGGGGKEQENVPSRQRKLDEKISTDSDIN